MGEPEIVAGAVAQPLGQSVPFLLQRAAPGRVERDPRLGGSTEVFLVLSEQLGVDGQAGRTGLAASASCAGRGGGGQGYGCRRSPLRQSLGDEPGRAGTGAAGLRGSLTGRGIELWPGQLAGGKPQGSWSTGQASPGGGSFSEIR
jgi:hypothetical protein